MNPDDPTRPDPDALLAAAKRASRGKLKVFLGMAPGVGKTYEMLRAARKRKADGADVVIGVVETHGRRETESLLRGLEVLPRRPLEHRGRSYMEFDIDGALARRPKLLLVDEYAHSNAPGSRHPKRWQDVEELLVAGLDVWTTLNVQHLESLVDVVQRITGVRQRETVPDSALSRADDIELIDITPEELRERLADGKVYLPDTARLAADNYFKPENLVALRELALRRAAQTVDDQLVGVMRDKGIEGPWAAGERILVLVGGDAVASSLVRAGRRLSDTMDAPWTVAHVERPDRPPPGALAAQRLNEALKLTEQLGGATVVLTGEDLPQTILSYARRNNVTQIVIGQSPPGWRERFGRSLAQALLKRAAGTALHIVTDAPAQSAPEPPPRPAFTFRREISGYIIGAAFVAAASGVAFLLDRMFENANLGMIYLSAVLAAGVLYGLRPALAAATVAFLVYNFFFLQPRYSFAIGSPTDILTLIVFWAVALAVGGLAGRVRDQARATSQRASAIAALLAASRRLAAAAGKEAAALVLAEQTAAAIGGKAVVLLPDGTDVKPAAGAPDPDIAAALSAADMGAARWAWEKGEPAGAGTGTLPQAAWTFHPLQGLKARAGVAGVEARGDIDERYLLALLDQGAVALERAELAAEAADAEALRRSDRLRTALLNSISHDLRTPLATVMGAATTLLSFGEKMEKPVRRDLLSSISEEADRLNRYVGDLLDMSRLEGGALKTRSQWTDVRDVLDAAATRVSRRLGRRVLVRDVPAELASVKLDASLLEQAVVNILENAVAYGPDGSRIEVSAYEDLGNVVISVDDEGPGIPKAELDKVFDKFRRLEESTDRVRGPGQGVGLGLSIAKGFVEAMGGRIVAVSPLLDGKGTRVLISLPKTVRTHPSLL